MARGKCFQFADVVRKRRYKFHISADFAEEYPEHLAVLLRAHASSKAARRPFSAEVSELPENISPSAMSIFRLIGSARKKDGKYDIRLPELLQKLTEHALECCL